MTPELVDDRGAGPAEVRRIRLWRDVHAATDLRIDPAVARAPTNHTRTPENIAFPGVRAAHGDWRSSGGSR